MLNRRSFLGVLAALIPVSMLPASIKPKRRYTTNVSVGQIRIANLVMGPHFRHKDGEWNKTVDKLKKSIQEIGVVNPIVVCGHRDGWLVINGHLRVIACQCLNMEMIPAFVMHAKHANAHAHVVNIGT